MDFGRLFKWLLIIAIVVIAWKLVLPWVKQQSFGASSKASASGSGGGDDSCIRSAEAASEAWGSGLRPFINPPVDQSAWSSFRSDVESKISKAESRCNCDLDSCRKVRSAMRDLRGLVNDTDSALRNGSGAPDGMVQRQESIDNDINAAGDLLRSGK